MPLPAPNLDDRRFQELVDDAKRYVQKHCPEWTDHNVSDPGVTLIELFAWMTDLMVYRMNRVPERNYVKFLEMIGVKLFPPTAAKVPVTFWLSAPQPDKLTIAKGTEIATSGSEAEEEIVFATISDFDILPCSLQEVFVQTDEATMKRQTDELHKRTGFFSFDKTPKAGDSMLLALSDPVPGCAVMITADAEIEGVGVDPTWPPLVWEAYDGDNWMECELDSDTTGGLNRGGDVIIHVPRSHTAAVLNKQRAGWIRCRVTEPEDEQPFYQASPKVTALEAATIGGTSEAVHARIIEDEVIGISEGVAGQRFKLLHRPAVPTEQPFVVEVPDEEGWEAWTEVKDFYMSGPDDKHFVVDYVAGEIQFGPAVLERDGSLRQFGRIPEAEKPIRVPSYRHGGGRRGNVAADAISVLKSSIPFVARVANRHPGNGGVDPEDIENAKVRGPILLRSRDRAVTYEDFEVLAADSAPEVARIKCVAAGDGSEAGSVILYVVPKAEDDEEGKLELEKLIPQEETLARITEYIDSRRLVGTRVLVEAPTYLGLTVVAKIKARPRAKPQRLQKEALRLLYSYFHPIHGGPDGDGWPFGRPVQPGDVYSLLQSINGVEYVEDVRLFAANLETRERGKAEPKIEPLPNALILSFEHQVLVNA